MTPLEEAARFITIEVNLMHHPAPPGYVHHQHPHDHTQTRPLDAHDAWEMVDQKDPAVVRAFLLVIASDLEKRGDPDKARAVRTRAEQL